MLELRQLGARSATRRRRPPSSGSTSAPASTRTTPPAIFDGSALTIAKGDALSWYVKVPPGGALVAHAEGAGCNAQGARGRARRRQDRRAFAANGPGAPLDLGAARRQGGAPVAHRRRRQLHDQVGGAHRQRRRSDGAARAAPEERRLLDDRRHALRQVQALQPEDARRDAGHRRVRQEGDHVQGRLRAGQRVARLARLACGPRSTRSVTTSSPRRPSSTRSSSPWPRRSSRRGATPSGSWATASSTRFWGFGEGWDVLKNHIHDGGGLKAEDFVVEAKQDAGQARRQALLHLHRHHRRARLVARAPAVDRQVRSRAVRRAVRQGLPRSAARPDRRRQARRSPSATRRASSRSTTPTSATTISSSASCSSRSSVEHADDTMVIFTADHGEELWDHGKIGHGQSLREELVHVPLLISLPAAVPAGQERRRRASRSSTCCRPSSTRSAASRPPTRRASRWWRWRRAKAPAIRGRRSRQPVRAGAHDAPRPLEALGGRLGRRAALRRGRRRRRGQGAVGASGRSSGASSPTRWACGWRIRRKWKKARWGVASNHKPELARDLEARYGSRFQQMISSVSARTNAGSRPTSA